MHAFLKINPWRTRLRCKELQDGMQLPLVNELAHSYDVHIALIPGHDDVPNNFRADKLVTCGTALELFDKFSTLAISLKKLLAYRKSA